MFLVVFYVKNGDVVFNNAKFGKWFRGARKNLTALSAISENIMFIGTHC